MLLPHMGVLPIYTYSFLLINHKYDQRFCFVTI